MFQIKCHNLNQEKGDIVKYDNYLNTVTLALIRILHKLNWASLKTAASPVESSGGGAEGSRQKAAAAKNIHSSINLLSWQLATFCDIIQKV